MPQKIKGSGKYLANHLNDTQKHTLYKWLEAHADHARTLSAPALAEMATAAIGFVIVPANIDTARKATGLQRAARVPPTTDDPRVRILAQQVMAILDRFPQIVPDPRVAAMARRAPAPGNGGGNHESDGRQVALGIGAT